MNKLKLAIFDMGGTVIDKNCQAPVDAFKEAFLKQGISISEDLIRKDMGMSKHQHILEIFKTLDIEDDLKLRTEIYKDFEKILFDIILDYCDITDDIYFPINDLLFNNNVSIAWATGYSKLIADRIKQDLLMSSKMNLVPEYIIFDARRPSPFAIHMSMISYDIWQHESVICIGDTINDIKSGVNAKVKTGGILNNSSILAQYKKKNIAANKMRMAGASYIFTDMNDLLTFFQEVLS